MRFYDGSVVSALIQLFPSLALEERKFKIFLGTLPSPLSPLPLSLLSPSPCSLLTKLTDNYWEDKTNRRKFFENFAREKAFDPLNAEEWSSVPQSSVLACQVWRGEERRGEEERRGGDERRGEEVRGDEMKGENASRIY